MAWLVFPGSVVSSNTTWPLDKAERLGITLGNTDADQRRAPNAGGLLSTGGDIRRVLNNVAVWSHIGLRIIGESKPWYKLSGTYYEMEWSVSLDRQGLKELVAALVDAL